MSNFACPTLRVPIVSCERQLGLAGQIQLGEQRLVNGDVPAAKSMRGAGKVKTPNAISRFMDEGKRFGMMPFQPAKPIAQCQRIRLAQVLHIANLKPSRLGSVQHIWERWKVAFGKDVFLDEGAVPVIR